MIYLIRFINEEKENSSPEVQSLPTSAREALSKVFGCIMSTCKKEREREYFGFYRLLHSKFNNTELSGLSSNPSGTCITLRDEK